MCVFNIYCIIRFDIKIHGNKITIHSNEPLNLPSLDHRGAGKVSRTNSQAHRYEQQDQLEVSLAGVSNPHNSPAKILLSQRHLQAASI